MCVDWIVFIQETSTLLYFTWSCSYKKLQVQTLRWALEKKYYSNTIMYQLFDNVFFVGNMNHSQK